MFLAVSITKYFELFYALVIVLLSPICYCQTVVFSVSLCILILLKSFELFICLSMLCLLLLW